MNKKYIILTTLFCLIVCFFMLFKEDGQNKKSNVSPLYKTLEYSLLDYELTYGELPESLAILQNGEVPREPSTGIAAEVTEYTGTGGWIYNPKKRIFDVNLKDKENLYPMHRLSMSYIKQGEKIWNVGDVIALSSICHKKIKFDPKGCVSRITFNINQEFPVLCITYYYDEAKRIIQKIVELPKNKYINNYVYDKDSQLIFEKNKSQSTRYYYDTIGNRESIEYNIANMVRKLDYQYSKNDEFFPQSGCFLMSWEPSGYYKYANFGKLIGWGVTNITRQSDEIEEDILIQWNCDNSYLGYQVIYARDAKKNSNYYFNSANNRCWRSEEDHKRFFILKDSVIDSEVNEKGEIIRIYQYDNSTGEILSFQNMTEELQRNEKFFCLTDIQGSVIGIVNQDGKLVESYEYDAFGNLLAIKNINGEKILTSLVGNVHLWQGAEYLWEAKLYNFAGRLYDPKTGRWLTQHPIGYGKNNINFFSFCFNDPVNKIWRHLPKIHYFRTDEYKVE